MKLLLSCCVLLFFSIFSLAYSSKEVVTEHVTVVYSNPDHLAYAKRVAYEAEQALDKLIPLFRWKPRLITLIIDSDSGYLSGVATPFPHPSAIISGVDDIDGFDYRTTNLIYALVIHELFHVMQGTYSNPALAEDITQSPDATAIDLQIAPPVPTWFVEGIATWSQTYDSEQYGISGSRSARVTGVVETLALEGKIPDFKSVGSNHNGYYINQWPGRLFPYDIGGAFSHYLVESYGFEAILETLTEYNQLGFWGGFTTDFSTAWRTTQGSLLSDIWIEWQNVLKGRAQARANALTQGKQLTYSGNNTLYPVVSPDGSKLAWSMNNSLWIAQLNDDGSLHHPRSMGYGYVWGKFDWLDNHHIVYIDGEELVKQNIHQTLNDDLDKLSLLPYLKNNSAETKRRFGLLRFADSLSQECVLLIQHGVYGQSDELWRWCNGRVDSWIMPENVDLIDATASETGQIVLNIWQSGFTDFALFDLNTGTLNYLTQDVGQDLDPVWLGEDSIVFRSDRHKDSNNATESSSVYDLYRLDISTTSITRLTRSLGGAFRPSVHTNQIWYNSLTAKGYDVSVFDISNVLSAEVEVTSEVAAFPKTTIDIPDYDVRGYEVGSSLLPDALVPEFFIPDPGLTGFNFESIDKRAGVALLGQDRARKHTYYIGTGYQFNPENDGWNTNGYIDSETGEFIETEDTFSPYWYNYLDYTYYDRFGTAEKLEYQSSANLNLQMGPNFSLGANASISKTIDISKNFQVKPRIETGFGWSSTQYDYTAVDSTDSDTIYTDRYSFNIQPALDLQYKLYVADIALSLISSSQFAYAIQSGYVTSLREVNNNSSSGNNLRMSHSTGISLGKSFVGEASVWDTSIGASANLDYQLDLGTGIQGTANINRHNTDNWKFNFNTNLGSSFTDDGFNSQSVGVNQNFAYKFDLGDIGLNLTNRVRYSMYNQSRKDIEDNQFDSSNSDFDFQLDLDAFYAFSDLLQARALLHTQAQYNVQPSYSPETEDYTESQNESISSFVSFSLSSYEFEGLNLVFNYQHPIQWYENYTSDNFIDNNSTQNNYDGNYRNYPYALTQNPRVSFRVDSLYNPSYELNRFVGSLEVGAVDLYDAPYLYSDIFLGYNFDNYRLKDTLGLNIQLTGGDLYQPNIDLTYSFSLPPLVTWDGKYGFQDIYVRTGIDYDIPTNEFGTHIDIYFDTIFSYQWNLGFWLGVDYSNGEWQFSLF